MSWSLCIVFFRERCGFSDDFLDEAVPGRWKQVLRAREADEAIEVGLEFWVLENLSRDGPATPFGDGLGLEGNSDWRMVTDLALREMHRITIFTGVDIEEVNLPLRARGEDVIDDRDRALAAGEVRWDARRDVGEGLEKRLPQGPRFLAA